MAKQRKGPRAVKLRTGLLTRLLIVILLAALACKVYALQEQVSEAEAEKDRVAALVESRRQENDALAADIEEGCTSEKMQEIARRELGWVLPGEYVFDVGS
ncbi:MAG: septum formation initiator family protein [Dysosmobacter sp.]|nr:septum formation initiator family protein [Dysosmobacter sp.]